MKTEVLDTIETVDAASWNGLTGSAYPFLRHEFLAALERHGAVGPRVGWIPHYLIARADDDGRLLGAVPAWLKYHSRGEFVFDFAWADAYARHGHAYYPKLVSAVPWTPATGPRLLVAAGEDRAAVRAGLAAALRAAAADLRVSSAHCLFAAERDAEALQAAGFLQRSDFHYFWHNRGYSTFDDYLGAMTSRKRKKIRQERRYVAEQGLRAEIRHGGGLDHDEWSDLHGFYADTFARKTNLPVLSVDFFREIGRTMGEQIVVSLAHCGTRRVAGAIMLRGSDRLYGRYWGSIGDFPGLHFETCYYQGIEYCIRHGLRVFEPGVQGEHKIARGFVPTRTRSLHWIAHPAFRAAIAEHLERERVLVEQQFNLLSRESPFREDRASAG